MNSTLGRLAFGKTLRNGGGRNKIAPRRFFASGWKPRLRMTEYASFLCHPEVSAAKPKDLREAMIVLPLLRRTFLLREECRNFGEICRMLRIGVTGGIGSGKSTVIKILAELGATIVDADKVAHSVYAPGGSAYEDVVGAFGEGILAPDRSIDRKKLGAIVFGDPAALGRLTAIVWPRTFDRMREMVGEIRARGERAPIVIEAAVLIEAKWNPLFDEIWLVTAPRERVIERVQLERGMKPEQTEARIRAQLSDDERRSHATVVIANDGSIEELRGRLATLWAEVRARAGG